MDLSIWKRDKRVVARINGPTLCCFPCDDRSAGHSIIVDSLCDGHSAGHHCWLSMWWSLRWSRHHCCSAGHGIHCCVVRLFELTHWDNHFLELIWRSATARRPGERVGVWDWQSESPCQSLPQAAARLFLLYTVLTMTSALCVQADYMYIYGN